VYCDIPYKDVDGHYLSGFNHQEFYEWALSRKFPVYVSEFEIDDSRFKCIYEIERRPMFDNGDTRTEKVKVEKLYWNGVK